MYALSIILYDLLAGTPPHHTDSVPRGDLLELLRLIREVDSEEANALLATLIAEARDSHPPESLSLSTPLATLSSADLPDSLADD